MRVLVFECPAGHQYELGHRFEADDDVVPLDPEEAVTLARRRLPDLQPESLVGYRRVDRPTPRPGSREHGLLLEELTRGLEPCGHLMMCVRTVPRPTLSARVEPIDLRDLVAADDDAQR